MSNVIEEYYKKERNNLIKRIKNRAGSIDNAEDVVQEAFCRALQYFDAYNSKGDFGGWFNSILENALKQFKNEEKMGGATLHIEEVEEDFHDEIVDHYLPAMKNLKPHHQKIVTLYFKKGYTMPEIANATNTNIRSVEKFLERFKEKIRVGND